MDFFSSTFLTIFFTFLAGAACGALGYRFFTPAARNAEKLQQQLADVEGDLESYKKSVTGHFNKTSELVNELTEDYIKVYRHLAQGAQTLGDPKEIVDMLEDQQSKILISFNESPPEEVAEEEAKLA